jgi:hypothetical protein
MDPYGSWGEHVDSWLGIRADAPDFLAIRYEDLKNDASTELVKIADFLQLNVDASTVSNAIDSSRFDNMRRLEKETGANWGGIKGGLPEIPFVRTGKSGQWQDELSDEDEEAIVTRWASAMARLGYT